MEDLKNLGYYLSKLPNLNKLELNLVFCALGENKENFKFLVDGLK